MFEIESRRPKTPPRQRPTENLINPNREVEYVFSNMLASNISEMPEPFRSAVERSALWRRERDEGRERTGCLTTIFPKDEEQDVNFSFFCAHEEGYRLNDIFHLKL